MKKKRVNSASRGRKVLPNTTKKNNVIAETLQRTNPVRWVQEVFLTEIINLTVSASHHALLWLLRVAFTWDGAAVGLVVRGVGQDVIIRGGIIQGCHLLIDRASIKRGRMLGSGESRVRCNSVSTPLYRFKTHRRSCRHFLTRVVCLPEPVKLHLCLSRLKCSHDSGKCFKYSSCCKETINS